MLAADLGTAETDFDALAATVLARCDAIAQCTDAEWLDAIECASSSIPGLVTTLGRISCEQDAANVIPGLVQCSPDVRHADDAIRRAAIDNFLRTAKAIGNRRDIEIEYVLDYEQIAVVLDRTMVALADQAASEAGVSSRHMTSGAGHDAMIVAAHVPSVMIFLRSPDGISHHPDEAVYAEDAAGALRAGIRFIDGFEGYLKQVNESEQKSCTT